VDCSSPHSKWSARCHLSEKDLTRQRLVTFLPQEIRPAVLQGVEAPATRRKTDEVLSVGAALNACRSSKRSAESSV
jgi:hypothetical protein